MPTSPWTRYDPRALRRSWDRQQEYHVPEREERFEVMLDLLAASLAARPRILDLGCGTGSLSERVLRRFPSARVWAVDYDPVLLRIGREGLGDVGGRLTWVEGDLRTSGWLSQLPRGRFDAVVSTTALHWLRPKELKQLFRSLAPKLRTGGLFLNGDSMPYGPAGTRSRSPRIVKLVRAVRASRKPARPPPGVLPWEVWWKNAERLPALQKEFAERQRRYPHAHEDIPTPSVLEQMAMLRAAGFHETAVVWQQLTNRVLVAVR